MSSDPTAAPTPGSPQEPKNTEEPKNTDGADSQEYGSLSVEDDPEGTVDPADLAGTADESDEDAS